MDPIHIGALIATNFMFTAFILLTDNVPTWTGNHLVWITTTIGIWNIYLLVHAILCVVALGLSNVWQESRSLCFEFLLQLIVILYLLFSLIYKDDMEYRFF